VVRRFALKLWRLVSRGAFSFVARAYMRRHRQLSDMHIAKRQGHGFNLIEREAPANESLADKGANQDVPDPKAAKALRHCRIGFLSI
jgi:hypothetical protein